MTAPVRNPAKCKKCGETLKCRCGQVHTNFTKFSDWIRSLDDSDTYDVQNIDFIRFHYKDGWLISIEEKTFGAGSNGAQGDTQSIIKQLLQLSSGSKVDTLRGNRPIVYKGHFVVSFEKETPDDSAWVNINGTRYKNVKTAIVYLLKYGIMLDEAEPTLLQQAKQFARSILPQQFGKDLK